MAVFAHGLNGKTNDQIIESCQNKTIYDEAKSIFIGDTVDADIYKGGIFLGCTFGVFAMYVWAVGILAAGQSSTVSFAFVFVFGTY